MFNYFIFIVLVSLSWEATFHGTCPKFLNNSRNLKGLNSHGQFIPIFEIPSTASNVENTTPKFFRKIQGNASRYFEFHLTSYGEILKMVRGPLVEFCQRTETLSWDPIAKVYNYKIVDVDLIPTSCRFSNDMNFYAMWTDKGDIGIICGCTERVENNVKYHEIQLFIVVDLKLYFFQYEGNSSFMEWKYEAMKLLGPDALHIDNELSMVPYTEDNFHKDFILIDGRNVSNCTLEMYRKYCKTLNCKFTVVAKGWTIYLILIIVILIIIFLILLCYILK